MDTLRHTEPTRVHESTSRTSTAGTPTNTVGCGGRRIVVVGRGEL
jgi:hypothetical protein